MNSTRVRATLAVLAVAVAGCAAGVGLWAAGRVLEGPPLRSWDALSRWYEVVGPTVAVMATLRLVGMCLAIWVVLAAAAELVAELLPRSGFRLVADLIAPRSLRRIARGLAGLSLTAGLTTVAPSAGMPGDPPSGVAVMRLLSDPPPAPAATPAPMGTAMMRPLDVDTTPPVDPVWVDPVSVAPVSVAPMPSDFVVVEPGDSLWSIAEEAIRDANAVPPTDANIARYWRQVIEANRDALVDPTNPDLIYPGQSISLPSA